MRVEKGHNLYEKCVKEWRSQPGKPKWITLGGMMLKVYNPGQDDMFFVREGGIDEMYGGTSSGSLSG